MNKLCEYCVKLTCIYTECTDIMIIYTAGSVVFFKKSLKVKMLSQYAEAPSSFHSES